jgi:hypothetical protein
MREGTSQRGFGVLIRLLLLVVILIAIGHFASQRRGAEFIGMSQSCRTAPEYCEQTEKRVPDSEPYSSVSWVAALVIALGLGAAAGIGGFMVGRSTAPRPIDLTAIRARVQPEITNARTEALRRNENYAELAIRDLGDIVLRHIR